MIKDEAGSCFGRKWHLSAWVIHHATRSSQSPASVVFALLTKDKDLLEKTMSSPNHKCEAQDTDIYDKEMVCNASWFYRDRGKSPSLWTLEVSWNANEKLKANSACAQWALNNKMGVGGTKLNLKINNKVSKTASVISLRTPLWII